MIKIYRWAVGQSFRKLDPRHQVKNTVMFVVYLGAHITTILCFYPMGIPLWFTISITIFLWLTVLFANFAEAVAEG
ncbi:potassium-transporting ATPase subunit B, partial [Enterococcus faecalis]